MKTTRLILGIITIVLFVIIAFQSCAAGVVNSINQSNDVGGGAGLIVAFLSLIAGIVAVATRSSVGGAYTSAGFYLVSGIIGMTNSDVYKNLSIWSSLFIIFGIVFIIAGRKTSKNAQ